MFSLSAIPLFTALGLDLGLFLLALLAWRKLAARQPGTAWVLTLFCFQLAVLLVALGPPVDGLELRCGASNIEAANLYPVDTVGSVTFDAPVQGRVGHPREEETRISFSLRGFDDPPQALALELAPALGRPSRAFEILAVVFFWSMPWGEMPAFTVEGEPLSRLLRSPKARTNVLRQRGGALVNKPVNPAMHSWLVVSLDRENLAMLAGQWNYTARTAVFAPLAILLFFVLYGVYLAPAVTRIALAHARGRERGLRGRIAYATVAMAVSLGFFLLLLLGLELGLRYHFREVRSAGNQITYFYYKWEPLFKAEHNAFDFRGAPFDLAPNKAYRVVVLGDSFAYGDGLLPYTDRFPEQAAAMLNQRAGGPAIEMINLGVPGNNLPQHNMFLDFIFATSPDYILYQWYVNDMDVEADIAEILMTPLLPFPKAQRFFMGHSVLYYLLNSVRHQVEVLAGGKKSYDDYLVARFSDPDSEYSRRVDRQLGRLFARIKARGIPCGVVLFPSTEVAGMGAYKLGFLHDRVRAACERHGIGYLDLREAFGRYDEDVRALWVNRLDAHPSRLAHRVAAEEIVARWGDFLLQQANVKEQGEALTRARSH